MNFHVLMILLFLFFSAEERYILFMAGEAVNEPGKKFTLDHTVLAMPMTGHIKNEIRELCSIA